MTTPATRVLTFSVLVDKQQGAYVGHCLETGLVATSKDESDVLSKMGKLLERQVLFALNNDRLRDIYHPAPKEIWDKWQKMEERVIGNTQRALTTKKKTGFFPSYTINQTSYAAAC